MQTRYKTNQRDINRGKVIRQPNQACGSCLYWKGNPTRDVEAYCQPHGRNTPCAYSCSLWQQGDEGRH